MLALVGLLTQCQDPGRDVDVTISDVQTFFGPDDNRFVKLQPATPAALVFEWDQARAQDGTLVLYEVAFDKESGDFSKPIYKLTSDNNGVVNKATISHKDLNKIAGLAGIPSLGTGKVKWTVLASRGINVRQAGVSRTLQLERPAGFTDVPADVYLTGDATEAGTDLSKAIRMKQLRPGEFEAYTSLKAGTYRLVDRLTGTAKAYSVDGPNIRENGQTTVTGAAKPVRISLDFNNAAVKIAEIREVALWYSNDNDIRFTFRYAGASTWRADSVKIIFPTVPWGKEERYKFRLKTSTDGVAAEEWLGSSNSDNSRADANSPASYFYLFPIPASQWDYSYKFNGAVDTKTVDLLISLAPTAPYFHRITIR